MPINVYLLNRTYIAQDSTTGLTAYDANEKAAAEKLTKLLTDYWDKKKVVVPITTDQNQDVAIGIKEKNPALNS